MLPATSVLILKQYPRQYRQPCRWCIGGIREPRFFYIWPLSSVSRIFRFLECNLFPRQVNNNSHLLPNITLGVEIRDDCGTVNTALEQCLNFFVGTLANKEQICSLLDSSFRVQRRAVLGGVVGPSFSTTAIQVSITCMLQYIVQFINTLLQ